MGAIYTINIMVFIIIAKALQALAYRDFTAREAYEIADPILEERSKVQT